MYTFYYLPDNRKTGETAYVTVLTGIIHRRNIRGNSQMVLQKDHFFSTG
jgi:hypothetical protein